MNIKLITQKAKSAKKAFVLVMVAMIAFQATPAFADEIEEVVVVETEETTCTGLELLSNNSFDTPLIENEDGWDVFPSPVDGWTVEWLNTASAEGKPELGQLEYHANGFYAGYAGPQFAELDSSWQGPAGDITEPHDASVRISQTIATIPGATYQIEFYFSPRPGYSSMDNRLQVVWDGSEVATIAEGGLDNTNTVWTKHTFSVKADETSTRLEFADAGTSDSFGTFIDEASLKCVSLPEVEEEEEVVDEPRKRNSSTRRSSHANPDSSSGGEVLGVSTSTTCGEYLAGFIWKNRSGNDPEQVKKLQAFLNEEMGTTLEITGEYNEATILAVNAFQLKYSEEVLAPWVALGLGSANEATGNVYKTTRHKINEIKCATLNAPEPMLP